jgi:ankyrin repeat protein
MTPQDSLFDRIISGLKNNPVAGILLAAGTIVIALASFTNAAGTLLGLFKGHSPASARAELSALGVEFTSQEFLERVNQGDARAVKLFVAAGIDPNTKNAEGNIALMPAIAEHRTDIITALLAGKIDVNQTNDRGSTALDWAAARGQLDTVRLLLEKGASPGTIDEGFVAAAETGYVDVMRLLLEKGARVDEVGSKALLAAARSTSVGADVEHRNDAVKLLLSRGVNVNAKDNEGWTPLLLATDHNMPSVVQTLLDGNADVNAKCECSGYLSGGWTALMVASREGRADLVKMLVARHAVVDLRNKTGRTALAVAAAKGDADVARILLDDGADANAPDDDGRTPLMYAAAEGNLDVVRLLLQRGARVADKDHSGKTAMQLARPEAKAELARH